MSLESKIQELTETVSRLIDTLNAQPVPMVSPAPVPVQSTPVMDDMSIRAKALLDVAAMAPAVAPVQPAPAVAPVPVAAPAMPAPPTFTAPAPVAPAPTGVPFTDGKGLIGYVMDAYKAMGPQKGAQIQTVLTGLGYQNINDVKPEHYAALYAGVETLKG